MLRASLVLAFCAGLAACAGINPTDAPSLTKAGVVAPGVARDAVVAGKSTRRDVLALLGETAVVGFESGYEVWVYHLRDGASAGTQDRTKGQAEFVILFDPSGVVAKTRIRPAPPKG